MDKFKPYESKPITRMAFQITQDVTKSHTEESVYCTEGISFKAYESPKQGDWVVRLTQEDTYHVSDVVFRERNIVP